MQTEHVKAVMDAVEMCCNLFGVAPEGIIVIIHQGADGCDVGVELPDNKLAPALLHSVADAYQRGIDEGMAT